MLKKVLAGSTAGVLALSAMASTAMAADDYTIVFEAKDKKEMVTLELSSELTTANITALLGGDANAKADISDDSKNSYSNILLSAWIKEINGLQGIGKDGKPTQTTYSYNDTKKDISFEGGKIDVSLVSSMTEWVAIPIGKTLPADMTAEQLGLPAGTNMTDTKYNAYKEGVETTATILARKGINGGVAGWKADYSATDTNNLLKGPEDKEFVAEMNIDKNAVWLKSTGTVGYANVPVVVKGSFAASATNRVEAFRYNKSKVNLSFTVKMPGDMFRAMFSKVAPSTSWDWNGTTWDTNITNILNTQNGVDVTSQYFGIVGESGVGNFINKGGVSSQVLTKVVKATSDETEVTQTLPAWGKATVGLGVNATPTRLKNLNNGGTVTFEFDRDMWNGVFGDVEVIWRADSGRVKYPLATDYKWSEDGKSITVPLPAGLTYSEQTNSFNAFTMEYKIGTQHTGDLIDLNNNNNVGQYWSNNPTFWDARLVKITVSANKEAPKDDTSKPDTSSSGGLVEKPAESTPTSSSTSAPTSSTGNNGGSTGVEKNPGTGVAVAVAPVVLAAAAAAVVISKKRK